MHEIDAKVAARFWAKVKKAGPDECWEWQGSRSTRGYGWLVLWDKRAGRKLIRVNRLAWILTHGPIPEGMNACHSCDNPPCCNPAHIWLGTDADNVKDRDVKGRTAHQYGEAHGMAQLTAAAVLAIRADYERGKNQQELGRDYGTTSKNIHMIVRRKTWKHLPTMDPTP